MPRESGKTVRNGAKNRTDQTQDDHESRLQALIDAAPFGAHVYALEEDGRLVFLGSNAAADRILGVKNSQFIGMTIEAAFPALAKTDIPEAYRRVARTGEPYETEQSHYNENGIVGVFEVHAFQTGPGKVAALFRDVTERKNADSALAHSHDLMRYIIEHNRSAVAVHDRDLRYIYVSQRYLDEYKVKEKDIIGKHHYDVFPDLPQKWRDVHQKALRGEVLRAEDDPYQREDGTVDWTRWECRPWYEADGSIGGIIVYTEVITERKKAEEALRLSEEKFSTAFLLSPDGVNISRLRDGRYIEVNKGFTDILGYSRDEVIGRSALPSELGIWANRADRERLLAELEKTGEVNGFEAQFRRKDGSLLHGLMSGRIIEIDGEKCLISITRDITERKKAEEQLRLDDSRLQALLQLSQMTKASMQELAAFAMEEAVRLTGSTVGYVAFTTEDESTLIMHAWSKQAMAECSMREKPLVYPMESTGLWGEVVRQRRPIITNDYAAPNPLKKGTPEGHVRIERHMNVPIFDEGRVVIVAGVGNKATDYDESDVRQLTLLMDGMWRIMCRNKAEEELRRAESEKRQFYRDTIRSVTDGKLDITTDDELVRYLDPAGLTIRFASAEEVSRARMQIAEFCLSVGMAEDSTGLFLTAAGEALTNALKHAGEGTAYTGVCDGEVWVCVRDAGPGIAALSLPDATLRRGYSTKVSMGMGYSIMLDVSDRIMLSTGAKGTTVVLFKLVDESRPLLALEDLPDTWDTTPLP